MKRWISAFMLIMIFSSYVLALPEDPTFGLSEDSLEWKKAELEEWLVVRITKDLSRFVPAEDFKLYATAVLKDAKAHRAQTSNVQLSLLGTVATVHHSAPATPNNKGIFGKISHLTLSLIVSDALE